MTELDQVINSYIYESRRGEGGDKNCRFRATLPGYSPSVAYFPSRVEAAEAILKACGLPVWRRDDEPIDTSLEKHGLELNP